MTWLFLTSTPSIDFIDHYLLIKSSPCIYTKPAAIGYVYPRATSNPVWALHFYAFSSRARHRFRCEAVFR